MALHPKLIHQQDFTIRTYEIDRYRRATVGALIKLMQEAAMQNVIHLGLSVWDLEKEHISWVVLRMDIDLFRLPMLGETIRVVTHGAGFERLFTYRDYRVYDAQGALIAQSSSTWLLLDVQRRKPARIPDYIARFETPPLSECLPRPAMRMPDWNARPADRTESFRVQWHDLDFNGHLNNTCYIQWMLELVDRQRLEAGKLRRLEIQFKNECHWGDLVLADLQTTDQPDTFLHLLRRQSDGLEMAIARTFWAES